MDDNNWKKRKKRDPYEESRARTNIVLKTLSESQMERYVAFKQSSIPKKEVKRIISNTVDTPIAQTSEKQFIIGVAGVAKIFVGELIEKAHEVAEEMGELFFPSDKMTEDTLLPLRPEHIIEAYRRLSEDDPILKTQSLQ
eukprot:GHVP01008590.1.p1 GENE.GHVP01008590.1~~GHVP01008590.1.p1  ORF type:complete len:140 (-),score=36.84 GHVP01008590.1:102-521(-)